MTEHEKTDDIIPEYITLREALEFVAKGIRPLPISVIDEKKYIYLGEEETQYARARLIDAFEKDQVRIRGIFATIKMVLDVIVDTQKTNEQDEQKPILVDDYIQISVDFEKQGIKLSREEEELLKKSEKNKIFRFCYDSDGVGKYYPGMREKNVSLPLVYKVNNKMVNLELEIKRESITPEDLRSYGTYLWEYNLIVQEDVFSGPEKGDFWESPGIAFVEVYYPSLIKLMRNTPKKMKTNEKQEIILKYANKLPDYITYLSEAVEEVWYMLPEDLKSTSGYSKSSIRRTIENLTTDDGSYRFTIQKNRGCKPQKF